MRSVSSAASLAELGRAFASAGRLEDARRALEAAVAAESPPVEASPAARFELANVLHMQGRLAEAAEQYRVLICAFPGFSEGHYNLGVTEALLGRYREALEAYQRTLALAPEHRNARNNLAVLVQQFGGDAGRQEAARLYDEVRTPEARYNLALTRQLEGRLDDAGRLYEELLRDFPEHADARNNLGNIRLARERPAEALEEYRRAIAADPAHAEAQTNAGTAALTLGDWAYGFAQYEWRGKVAPRVGAGGSRGRRPAPARRGPRWNGEPLEGRTLLVEAEQGLGDTIQFCRFLPLAAARGGRVVVECHPPLVELVASVAGVEAVFPLGGPAPRFDAVCPMMSLPHALGIEFLALPAGVPYITVPEAPAEYWRTRVREEKGLNRLAVGLTWSGNPDYRENGRRTVPEAALAELGAAAGIRWINLQKDRPGAAIPRMDLAALETPATTLTDAAAIVEALDLVVSADTSMAHLAGALARPVWLMTPYAPDWRWMLGRSDSPWYPTMRLFRQSSPHDWTPIVAAIRDALEEFPPAPGAR